MKEIVILALYIIFITIFNISFLNVNINFIDYCNLLFLNIDSFQNYGLSIWNFKYIVSFYFLFVILINSNFSYINENSSFLSMVIYRKGKKKTVYDVLKYNTLKLLKYYIIINSIIVTLSVCVSFIVIENNILYNWFILNIYLIKIFLLHFFLTMKNFLDSLDNNFSLNIVKTTAFLFSLIFIDIIIHSNLISFSGNIICEIVYMIVYFLIVIIYYYIRIIRGGKND